MRPPIPLPPEVPTGPFLITDADDWGLPRHRLRRRSIARPTRGVACAGPEPTTLTERARCIALTLPEEAAFSHLTGLDLREIPRPGKAQNHDPLHVMFRTSEGRSRREGCIGHRGLESRRFERVDGLPLVSVLDSWLDLGELAAPHRWDIADLVVPGDEIVRRAARAEAARASSELRWLSGFEREVRAEEIAVAAALRCRQELAALLDRRVRPRGKRLLLQALPLLRHRSNSPMESRARVVFVLNGLPEPELNIVINAEDGSGYLGEGDFVWRMAKVIGEYQGEHHTERRQASLDADKRAHLEEDGWTVIPMWAEDIFHLGRRLQLIAKLRRHLA